MNFDTAAGRMDIVDLICKKRDGHELKDAEIDWIIDAYVHGTVADEQVAALLMAIFWRGLSDAALSEWTAAIIASGERMDLSGLSRPTVDKHSTGGVGDKVSLILAPLVAACGAAVPQLSGRGLGHTGGTLDKLDVDPRVALGALQRGDPRPAGEDRLRDLRSRRRARAGGPQALRAAGRDRDRGVDPAHRRVDHVEKDRRGHRFPRAGREGGIRGLHDRARSGPPSSPGPWSASARDHGLKVTAVLTSMDVPLGRAVGNALEVTESVEVLSGGHVGSDLVEITLALAREMLELAGIAADPAEALRNGSALARYRQMVGRTGGRPGRRPAPGTGSREPPRRADRHRRPPGRPLGRRGRLAPRCRQGAQGGPRERRGGHHLPHKAW